MLGEIITDAQLAATRSQLDGGAVIAFTNPGGIRTLCRRPGTARSPTASCSSSNHSATRLTLTLTGAQIKALLEQQWLNQPKAPHPPDLEGFSYTWDDKRPRGDFVAADGITLDGHPPDPAAGYRVTVNFLLAGGGGGFSVLKEGGEPRIGPFEVPALEAYFKADSPLSPRIPDRIERLE